MYEKHLMICGRYRLPLFQFEQGEGSPGSGTGQAGYKKYRLVAGCVGFCEVGPIIDLS